MATNWIPKPLAEFAAFCEKWKTGLSDPASLTDFGWTQADVTAVLAAIDAFLAAYAAWQAVDSSLNLRLRNEARDAAEKEIEHFANKSIRFNDKMSEAHKLEYGVITRHPGSTIHVPSTVPLLVAKAGHIRQVLVDYKDSASEKRGKPPKVHGIEIRWAIMEHPPADENELTNSAFDTRSPFSLTFDEKDRGKTVYFAGRWEINREGEKGDFSAIVSAVIP